MIATAIQHLASTEMAKRVVAPSTTNVSLWSGIVFTGLGLVLATVMIFSNAAIASFST